MKEFLPIIIVFVLAAGFLFGPKLLDAGRLGFLPPSPSATPTVPNDVPDLNTIFANAKDKKQAREHCQIASRFCASIAESIRQDQALEVPGFKFGVELNDLRLASLQYLLKGWKFSSEYPQFDSVVSGFLTKRTAGAEGELTPQMRDQWATAFDDLSKGFYKTYLDLFRETGGK